jgi:hypothetical protein
MDEDQLAQFAYQATDALISGADLSGLGFRASAAAQWTETPGAHVNTYLIEFDTVDHAAGYVEEQLAGLHLTPGVSKTSERDTPTGCWRSHGIGSTLPDSAAAGTTVFDCSVGQIGVVIDFAATTTSDTTAQALTVQRQLTALQTSLSG